MEQYQWHISCQIVPRSIVGACFVPYLLCFHIGVEKRNLTGTICVFCSFDCYPVNANHKPMAMLKERSPKPVELERVIASYLTGALCLFQEVLLSWMSKKLPNCALLTQIYCELYSCLQNCRRLVLVPCRLIVCRLICPDYPRMNLGILYCKMF